MSKRNAVRRSRTRRQDKHRQVQRFNHLDASESVYVAKQLERIKTNAYEVKVAATRIREFIPTGTGGLSPGTKAFTFKVYDHVGMAKIIAAYSDDLPRVDAFAREEVGKIKALGDSYGFSVIEDVQPAVARGEDLPDRKARTARRAIEELIAKIALTGDDDHGLLGMTNQPNVTVLALPNGAAASPLWTSKTEDEILKDLYAMEDAVGDATKNMEKPDTLLMPLAQYRRASRLRIDATSETTVLEYFLRTSKSIKTVEAWDDLAGKGAGGVSRMVAYPRNSETLELLVTREFEQLDPEQRNLEILTNCIAETGGVQVYFPLAMVYADGA